MSALTRLDDCLSKRASHLFIEDCDTIDLVRTSAHRSSSCPKIRFAATCAVFSGHFNRIGPTAK